MTQFIGWTTTHKPLNLKDWPLYMTQYIWSYSFAAQSKLMPNTQMMPGTSSSSADSGTGNDPRQFHSKHITEGLEIFQM